MDIKQNKQGEIELTITLSQEDAARVMALLFKQLNGGAKIKNPPRQASSLSQKLIRQREALGVPLEFVAQKMGVSVSCYRNYELGHRIPPSDRLEQIKKVFREIKKSQEAAVGKAQLELSNGGVWPAFGKPNIKLA